MCKSQEEPNKVIKKLNKYNIKCNILIKCEYNNNSVKVKCTERSEERSLKTKAT